MEHSVYSVHCAGLCVCCSVCSLSFLSSLPPSPFPPYTPPPVSPFYRLGLTSLHSGEWPWTICSFCPLQTARITGMYPVALLMLCKGLNPGLQEYWAGIKSTKWPRSLASIPILFPFLLLRLQMKTLSFGKARLAAQIIRQQTAGLELETKFPWRQTSMFFPLCRALTL